MRFKWRKDIFNGKLLVKFKQQSKRKVNEQFLNGMEKEKRKNCINPTINKTKLIKGCRETQKEH